ncbi:hypothetical protein NDU88_006640 [Pleurodeles waltl]|uniref:Uncharacterized protein n=1 Tax=Pleurodeles waltl TaxID=8319 RepID=A0AAV7WB91_PLEWA|nr:hypothetical protein NDU88_006640 [Pleurodeles waltl]
MTLCIPSMQSGATEECPGGTLLSVALLRHLEKASEDDAQCAVNKEMKLERQDASEENSATPENNGRGDESDLGTGREESSMLEGGGFQLEKKAKDGTKQRGEENSAASTSPEGHGWSRDRFVLRLASQLKVFSILRGNCLETVLMAAA